MKLISTNTIYIIFVISVLFAVCKSDDELNIVYPEGGYPYASKIKTADSNFYFLPIQKIISRKDSIMICLYKQLYTAFNEPNFSVTQPNEDIFRFYYTGSIVDGPAIFTLTKNKLIVKEIKTGSPYLAPDEKALDSIERLHYNLLDGYYPLSEAKVSERKKRYIDSLIAIYPQLLDPAYYLKLINKFFSVNQGSFEYSIREHGISNKEFTHVVNLINESDYWERPLHKEDCSITDASGFCLEAITKTKYQSAIRTLCPDDSSKLLIAYNEILKYAGIEYGKFGREDPRPVDTTQKIMIKELQLKDLKQESDPKVKRKKAQ